MFWETSAHRQMSYRNKGAGPAREEKKETKMLSTTETKDNEQTNKIGNIYRVGKSSLSGWWA